MKKLLLTVLVVLLAAGSAWAVDLQIKGDYYARGSYISNDAEVTADAPAYGYYDHDFNLYNTFVVDETTKLTMRLAIEDSNWPVPTIDNTTEDDDNIDVERLWLTHQFSTGTKLDVGKMSGGGWATSFYDDVGARYRIKATQFFPWGLLVGVIEKDGEQGAANPTVKDAENDDFDAYAFGAVIKAGPVNIKPIWFHVQYGDVVAPSDQEDGDLIRNLLQLGVDGSFGMIGFEMEVNNDDYDYDNARLAAKDYTLNSFYLNVWANLDAFKVGGIFAYGGTDDDALKAADFDDDFDLTLFLSDWIGWGGAGDGLMGCTAFQIYANFAFDKLSISPSYTFVTSNKEIGRAHV